MAEKDEVLTEVPTRDPNTGKIESVTHLEPLEANKVNASPTKEFFISMLVKDIPLIRSILDLVDNSVDGARREKGEGPYNDLWVRIELDENHFKIADNCGGMSIDQARYYAFRFGRPEGAEATPHSVGQFGVGMKRALFKLGKHFTVESTKSDQSFLIDIEVDEWKRQRDWAFDFRRKEDDLSQQQTKGRIGTFITVTNLHDGVADAFRLENFETRLINEIQAAHQVSIDKGLAITLNGIPLKYSPAQLLSSQEIKPAYKLLPFRGNNEALVTVKIYCGIAKSDPSSGGWYLFCNGRLILEADQSVITGWGEGNGKTIPKYHNQYARFRGYVFFDSDDASRLPWNTTKTGVDTDSPLYRAVRLHMLTQTRPVIDFLNKLAEERTAEQKPLQGAIDAAPTVALAQVKATPTFVVRVKQKTSPTKPTIGHVAYSRPLEQLERVKERLGVTSNREVGEKTFNYFYLREVERK